VNSLKIRLGKLESRLIPLPSVLTVRIDGEAPPGAADVDRAVVEARRRGSAVAVVMTRQLEAWAR
jgi:hypothetical protein